MSVRLLTRVLVVDDTPAIHDDFTKILAPAAGSAALASLGAELFGGSQPPMPFTRRTYNLSHAFQGSEALELVEASLRDNQPFSVVFVDMRMPPGWDGLETIRRLKEADPRLQVVICTAYSDQSWATISRVTDAGDDLLILKKPFDNIEVLQVAHTFSAKWSLARVAEEKLRNLDALARSRGSALVDAEQRFGAAFLGSSKAYAIVEVPSGLLLQTNAAFEALLQADAPLIGKSLSGLTAWLDHEEIRLAIQDLGKEGDPSERELELRLSTGEMGVVRFSSAPFLEGLQRRALVGLFDISDRRRLERQLLQSQKMEAIGSLAAGIAHDFNNMLTVVQGGASCLLLEPGLRQHVRENIKLIIDAADRAASLTRHLLVFSRSQPSAPSPVDVGDVLRRMEPMLRRMIGERIELIALCSEGRTRIRADAAHLEQIFMNLVVNARDALPEGGTIRISLDEVLAEPPPRARKADDVAAPHLRIRVMDDGTGMPPEIASRIFEPFFTTKSPDRGTGLGLSTVYGLVQQHRGWIEVESTPREGTTFCIHFPTVGDVALSSAGTDASFVPSRGNGERILVAEDDPSVRALLASVLTQQGYLVTTAGDGPTALALWNEHCGRFDLLISDMVMPGGLSGMDIARRLRQSSPSLGIVLASGHTEEIRHTLPVGEDSTNPAHFLNKPYDFARLLRTVQAALASGGVGSATGGSNAPHSGQSGQRQSAAAAGG